MKSHRAPILVPTIMFLLVALAIGAGPVGWVVLVMATGPLLFFILLGGIAHSGTSGTEYGPDRLHGRGV